MAKEHPSAFRKSFKNFYLISACISIAFIFQIIQVVSEECGVINVHRPLILGGNEIQRGEWPFIVVVLYKDSPEYRCGGTVLSKMHILTAAHCVHLKSCFRKYRPEEIEVRLGAYNLTADSEDSAEQRDISDIYVHPDWNCWENTYDADIAILVLSSYVTFNYYIQPICLPDDNVTIDDVFGSIVGWGYAESGSNQEIPRQTYTKSINDSHCYRTRNSLAPFSSLRTFCGGDGGGNPNKGDSGGGFFVVSHSRWVQYGIISVSQTNKTGHVIPKSFAVFTNVKWFKSWIIAIIEKIDCRYKYVDNMYTCHLSQIRRGAGTSHHNISSHQNGKTEDDVEAIYISNITMFLPENKIEKTFRNLKKFEIADLDSDTTKLHLISPHFRNLENLDELTINLYNDFGNDESFELDFLTNLINLKNFTLNFDMRLELHETTFQTNVKIKKIVLGSGRIASLPRHIFKENLLLEDVTLSSSLPSLRELDKETFRANKNLRKVDLKLSNMESVPRNLFKKKLLLEEVKIRTYGTDELDERLFETNLNLREVDLTIPLVASIPTNLFKNNLFLEGLKLKLKARTIDEQTFQANTKIRTIDLSLNMIEILPRNLFKNNSLLESVKIFGPLQAINEQFFENNLKLREIDLWATEVESLPRNLFKNNILLEKLTFSGLFVAVDEQNFQSNLKLKELDLDSREMNSLHKNSFRNNLLLEKLTISGRFKTLEGNVFETNLELREIEISSTLEFLHKNLFKNNLKLERLKLRAPFTTIDERAFESNIKLKEVELHSSLESLPRNLFKHNSILEKVELGYSLKTIDEQIFETNLQLKEVSISRNSLEFLPRDLFQNNLLLEKVDFSQNSLKIIQIDFSLMKNVKIVDFFLNSCISERYGKKMYDVKDLIQFQLTIRNKCSFID